MQNFNGTRQLGGGNTSCIELLAIEIQYLILEFINPLSALRLAHTSRKLYCVVRHNDAIWRQRYEKSYIPESDLEADLPRLLNRTNIETLSWFDINVRRELIEKRWRKGTLAASASITPFPDVPIAQLLLEAPDVCVTTEYTAVSCQNRLFFKSLHLEQWREIHLPGYHHRYNEAPIPSQVQSETNYTPETIADNRSRTLLGAFHLRGPFLLAYIWGRTRQCKLCVWDLRYVAAEIDCSLACKPLARYSGYTSILAGNYLATEEKDSTTSRMQVRDLAAAARRVPYNRPFCSNDPEVRQLVWPAGLTSFGHCHDVDDRHEPVLLCVGNRQPTKEVPTTLSTLERALWISTADLISPPTIQKIEMKMSFGGVLQLKCR
ncbi:hypothetical protein BDF19DRAFT_412149 [Syncephalis fuscata]|nr:hypothetical protein BDF19DRAFT_412149 [Syncephalis fuscata]